MAQLDANPQTACQPMRAHPPGMRPQVHRGRIPAGPSRFRRASGKTWRAKSSAVAPVSPSLPFTSTKFEVGQMAKSNGTIRVSPHIQP